VIDHEWHAEIPGDLREELHGLLAEAAREDAEAGFPSFSLDDDVPAGTRYLLVWLLPDERSGRDEPPPRLAGCLRLEPSGGTAGGADPDRAEVRLVIHPELRSRGISTSLCERLGLDVDADDGWAGTGFRSLYCWARGNHPAAQRMSLRFSDTGLRRARREWRLLALLRKSSVEAAATTEVAATDGSVDSTIVDVEPGKPGLDELWRRAGRTGSAPRQGRVLITGSHDSPTGAVWFDPGAAEPTEFGPAGLLRAVLAEPEPTGSEAGDGVMAALLRAGMAALRVDGARVAVITVADHEEALLTACRLAGFQHDQTDCEYVLG